MRTFDEENGQEEQSGIIGAQNSTVFLELSKKSYKRTCMVEKTDSGRMLSKENAMNKQFVFVLKKCNLM